MQIAPMQRSLSSPVADICLHFTKLKAAKNHAQIMMVSLIPILRAFYYYAGHSAQCLNIDFDICIITLLHSEYFHGVSSISLHAFFITNLEHFFILYS